MILIKTKMRKIPKCCSRCSMYAPGQTKGWYAEGVCTADYYRYLGRTRVSKERASFCPLKEVADRFVDRPKIAEWLTDLSYPKTTLYKCEVCRNSRLEKTNYCPYCGTQMKNVL